MVVSASMRLFSDSCGRQLKHTAGPQCRDSQSDVQSTLMSRTLAISLALIAIAAPITFTHASTASSEDLPSWIRDAGGQVSQMVVKIGCGARTAKQTSC